MPNYGMNPTTPDPKSEISAIPAPQNPMMRPRSIREYLQQLGQNRAMREAAGQVPTFTNRPQGAFGTGEGHLIVDRPQGAISDAKSQYESVPYEQRGSIDPYERMKKRLPEILPDIWQNVFPNRPQGSMLDDKEMQMWQKAVMNVTNALLEKYDREHGEYKKQKIRERKEAGKGFSEWQKKYWDLRGKGQLPVDPQTGEQQGEEEFIRERLQTATRVKGDDIPSNIKGQPKGLVGRKITGSDVASVMQDPQHKPLADKIRATYKRLSSQMDPEQAKREALRQHAREIMAAIGQ